MSSSGVGRDVHSDVVYPACPLPTTMLPTLQGALKDGFGEAVTVCDMPKPCKLLSLKGLTALTSQQRNLLSSSAILQFFPRGVKIKYSCRI